MRRAVLWVCVVGIATGCGDNLDTGTTLVFDLNADLSDNKTFYDTPFPNDLRLTADGTPDLSGYPNPRRTPLVNQLLSIASDRPGFPVAPVGYFQFSAPLAPLSLNDALAASPDSPILLVDVDPESPQRGRLFPTVAATLARDDWATPPVLGVSALPGVILAGDRTYAFVVKRSVLDAEGNQLGSSSVLRELAAGRTPSGALGERAVEVYAPLWPVLDDLGIDARDVAAATVFTTGDVVAELAELSDGVIARDAITIENLQVDPDDGASHGRFCELVATVDFPQFQTGEPPFNTGGLFELGADGLPIQQRTETANVVMTLPNGQMPSTGFPLMLYFHGSGGVPSQLVDRGTTTIGSGGPTPGEGPGFVVAEYGIAGVSASMPVNPERLPGASLYEYLNFENLASFRDTFRQGVIEQRLLVEALSQLRIDPATVSACTNLTLPANATEFFFDVENSLVTSGQSMGGMYTNLISAVEPRVRAAVPTGAGGFWSLMITKTELLPGALELVAAVFGSHPDDLSFMHPGLHLLAISWEAAEPFVSMPRLARRPLPGHPTRAIYQPVGENDSYFPTPVYDAAAVAFGHQEGGAMVWPEMQEALGFVQLDGLLDYPIENNLVSEAGEPYTGAVVQYAADNLIGDGHYIFAQLEEVKAQYGCFFATFLATGSGVVIDPAATCPN